MGWVGWFVWPWVAKAGWSAPLILDTSLETGDVIELFTSTEGFDTGKEQRMRIVEAEEPQLGWIGDGMNIAHADHPLPSTSLFFMICLFYSFYSLYSFLAILTYPLLSSVA